MLRDGIRYMPSTELVGYNYAIQINSTVYVSPAVYSFLIDDDDISTKDKIMQQIPIYDFRNNPEKVYDLISKMEKREAENIDYTIRRKRKKKI